MPCRVLRRSAWQSAHVDNNNIVGGRHEGEWWLPPAPDERVSGTLVVSERGEATLHLIGALGHRRTGIMTPEADDGALSTIHGQVGSRYFTLDRCFQTKSTGVLTGGPVRQELHVNRVMTGNVLLEEPFEMHKVHAWMDGLVHWAGRTGLSEDDGYDEQTGRSWTTIRLDHLPRASADLHNDGTVTLGHTWAVRGDLRSGRGVEQDFTIGLEWDSPSTLDALLAHMGLVQDLVSVALGRPCGYRRVAMFVEPSHTAGDAIFRDPPSVDVVANWVARAKTGARELNLADVRFTLQQMGGLPMLARWLEVANSHRGPLARVMATMYSRGMYISDRVLNCAAAVERYDKKRNGTASPTRRKGEISFKEQVIRCATYAGPEFQDLVGDVDAWGATFKAHRTEVAHHLEIGEDSPNDALGVAMAARWMFLLCLFRDCGMPQDVFQGVAQSGDWRWLKSRLRAEGIVARP